MICPSKRIVSVKNAKQILRGASSVQDPKRKTSKESFKICTPVG